MSLFGVFIYGLCISQVLFPALVYFFSAKASMDALRTALVTAGANQDPASLDTLVKDCCFTDRRTLSSLLSDMFALHVKSIEDADRAWPWVKAYLPNCKDQWRFLGPIRNHIRGLSDDKFKENGGVSSYLRAKFIVSKEYHFDQKAKEHQYRVEKHCQSIGVLKTTLYRLIAKCKLTIGLESLTDMELLVDRIVGLQLAVGSRLCELFSPEKSHFMCDPTKHPCGIVQVGKAKAKRHIEGQAELFRQFKISKPVMGMTATEFIRLHCSVLDQIQAQQISLPTLNEAINVTVSRHFPGSTKKGSHSLRKMYGLLSFTDADKWKGMGSENADAWTKEMWFMKVLGHTGFTSGLHYRIYHFIEDNEVDENTYIKELAEAHAMIRQVLAINAQLMNQRDYLLNQKIIPVEAKSNEAPAKNWVRLRRRDGSDVHVQRLPGNRKRKANDSNQEITERRLTKVRRAMDVLSACDVKLTSLNMRLIGVSSQNIKLFKDSFPGADKF